MLSTLHIENIALIESASIDFAPGFNALTGETGAGKSIVIDSISAVLGERTSRELIRSGSKSARVEAVLEPSSARRVPDCPHFPACGGCDFRHISYQEELEANTFDMIVSSIVDEDKEKVAEFLTRSETECGGSIGFCVRHKDGEMRTIMCDAEHSEENGELICQWFLLNFT